jgi:putative ABC transport system substrate-binding protein
MSAISAVIRGIPDIARKPKTGDFDPSATSASHPTATARATAVCYFALVHARPTALGEVMRRRDFITLVGGATVAWPIAARAQQAGNLRTVGVLGPEATVWSGWTAIFAKRLRELGWVEGNTLTIQYRWSEGRSDRAAEIAAEFVRLKVDCIVAPGSAIAILKRTAPTIPLVFPMAVDPVGSGLVAGLARPGGNVTGLSIQQTDLAGKRLELLREVVPQLRRLGIIADAGYADSMREMDEVQAIARKLGIEVAPLKI